MEDPSLGDNPGGAGDWRDSPFERQVYENRVEKIRGAAAAAGKPAAPAIDYFERWWNGGGWKEYELEAHLSLKVSEACAENGIPYPPEPARTSGVEAVLSEEDVGDVRFTSEKVRLEEGSLAVCHFRYKEGRTVHVGHDLLLSPEDIPTRHLNEFGEARIRLAGHLYTESQAIEQFRRMCPGSLNIRAFVAYLKRLQPAEAVTEALRLVADISTDSWNVVVPTDSPNPLTRLLVQAYKPGGEAEARLTYDEYVRFQVTRNQAVTLRFSAGAPVYQALQAYWNSDPIRPGLDRRGITKSGKTTDVDASINVLWGLRPVGLGGDFEKSGFRQQEGDESTNFPLHLDESQGDRRSQERRRHSRSGGLSGRGRSDRSIDWSRGIAPEIVTSNRRLDDAGGEYEAGANERRTCYLIDTEDDVRAIESRRAQYQTAGFARAPGGYLFHVLRRPENSPLSLVRWLEDRRGRDPRQLVLDLGAHLLELEEAPLSDLSIPSPAQEFISWLTGMVAAYFARRTQGSGNFETETPVHPELEAMMSVRTLEGKPATKGDASVEVRVTTALVLRYARDMRAAGREPAYTSPHQLVDLAPYTGQSENEIWPSKGHKRDVGGRNQVHANIRLLTGATLDD